MEYQNFEDYLEYRCFEENPTVLDDDRPDYFDEWISDIPVSAVIIYADGWMAKTKSDIRTEVLKITR